MTSKLPRALGGVAAGMVLAAGTFFGATAANAATTTPTTGGVAALQPGDSPAPMVDGSHVSVLDPLTGKVLDTYTYHAPGASPLIRQLGPGASPLSLEWVPLAGNITTTTERTTP